MDAKEILAIQAFYQDRADKLEATYEERIDTAQKFYEEKSKAAIEDVRQALEREFKQYDRYGRYVLVSITILGGVATWLGIKANGDYRNAIANVETMIADDRVRTEQRIRDADQLIDLKLKAAVEERLKNTPELMNKIDSAVNSFAGEEGAKKLQPFLEDAISHNTFLRKDTPYAIVPCQWQSKSDCDKQDLVLGLANQTIHKSGDATFLEGPGDRQRWLLVSK